MPRSSAWFVVAVGLVVLKVLDFVIAKACFVTSQPAAARFLDLT